MTKTYLVNASVAALVSAFVFSANITPAAACWGPNKEFGGAECGKGGGTDGASQSSSSQTQPQSSGSQTSQGPNTRPLPRPERPQQDGSNDRPSRQSDNGDWGGYGGGTDKRKDGDWGNRPSKSDDGDWGNRPKRTGDCRYGCRDDRPSRRPRDDDYGSYGGKVYHPNHGPYASDGYGYPSRRHGDDSYGGYGRRGGDVVVIRPPRIGVILGSGYGGYGRGGY